MGGRIGGRATVIAPAPELVAFLRDARLAVSDEVGDWHPLTGGISSDIWHVALRSGDVCVKRALGQLKVAAEWSAPLDRNAHEWNYLSLIGRIVPGHVPRPIAHDPERGLFAMAWLAPDRHRLWKSELLEGQIDPADAAAVGSLLGRIHASTAGDHEVAARFATDANFHALRIEPYLLATAARLPVVAPDLRRIARQTAATRLALVHGDVSPKNILLGPDGPVLLDAECAWYGDPAFDLAFCLNHLTIKARVVPGGSELLAESFRELASAYLAEVTWESSAELEGRAAQLLPALALARVDGKSPLDYLDRDQRDGLRRAAVAAIRNGFALLDDARRALLA